MDNKDKLKLVIPEYLDEVHVTGGAVASTLYNIRLILFNDELGYNDGVIDSDKINLVRTAKTEIVMHPAVAKQICELLASELKNYEDKLEKLNE